MSHPSVIDGRLPDDATHDDPEAPYGRTRRGSARLKPPSKGQATPRRDRSRAASRLYGELVTIAAEQGAPIKLGVSTADAMQECLDRAVALWRFAAQQVDKLDFTPSQPDAFFETRVGPGGATEVVPNRWYNLEMVARAEVEKLAGMMTQLGIAERQVQLEEAKAALMIAAIRDAAIEAGFDADQVRALGAALRKRLEDTQTATIPTPQSALSKSQDPATSRQVAEMGRD